MAEQLRLLPGYFSAHLELTLAALGLAIAIGVPLGVAVARRRTLEAPLLGVTSLIQTIPGLALLAIMVPALAALGAFTQRTTRKTGKRIASGRWSIHSGGGPGSRTTSIQSW